MSERSDHLRRHERSDEPRRQSQKGTGELRAARGAQHAPAHHLPRRDSQSEPGDQGLMAQKDETPVHEIRPVTQEVRVPERYLPTPTIEPGHSYASITD